jgi:hypothetical protein
MPIAHVARRTATGVVAWNSTLTTGSEIEGNLNPHLKHLDECHTQIQVCDIAANQTQTEE